MFIFSFYFQPMTMNSFEGSDKEKKRLPPHELVISLSFYNKKKVSEGFRIVLLFVFGLVHTYVATATEGNTYIHTYIHTYVRSYCY